MSYVSYIKKLTKNLHFIFSSSLPFVKRTNPQSKLENVMPLEVPPQAR